MSTLKKFFSEIVEIADAKKDKEEKIMQLALYFFENKDVGVSLLQILQKREMQRSSIINKQERALDEALFFLKEKLPASKKKEAGITREHVIDFIEKII